MAQRRGFASNVMFNVDAASTGSPVIYLWQHQNLHPMNETRNGDVIGVFCPPKLQITLNSFEAAREIVERIEDESISRDVSIRDLLISKGVSCDAFCCSNYCMFQLSRLARTGSTLRKCGMHRHQHCLLTCSACMRASARYTLYSELQRRLTDVTWQSREWDFGTRNFHVHKTYSEMVLQEFMTPLADAQLHLNWPINRIDYTSDHIFASSAHGRTTKADRVVITVPITVLQVSQQINVVQIT